MIRTESLLDSTTGKSLIAALMCLLLSWEQSVMAEELRDYRYSVVRSFPHDPDLFTQGLEFHQGFLYESTGQYGQSRILRRSLESDEPNRVTAMPANLFGEGITLLDGVLYQLTWRSQRGFMYDPDTLGLIGEFGIVGEGWGLASNGKELIVSNGSDTLSFLNPKDFSVLRQTRVTLGGKPLARLNELEWIDGLIYANVWRTDWIVMIEPESGRVVGRAGLHGLLPEKFRESPTGVLNGIAYDRELSRLLVTGKNWPLLFHIELHQKGIVD